MKAEQQIFIKIDVPFIDEISGLALIKLLDFKTGCTNTIKVKFVRNTGFLDVTNNSSESCTCSKEEALSVVDLISIAYFKENIVSYSTI